MRLWERCAVLELAQICSAPRRRNATWFKRRDCKSKKNLSGVYTSGLWWAWVDLNHRPRPYQRSEVRSYNNLQDRTNCRLGCGLGFSFEWARSPQTYSIEPFRTFQPCLSHSRSQHQLAAGMSQFELSECFAHVVEGEDSGNRHF